VLQFQQEQGQILVLFAITATAMLAMIGLLYSFGLVLNQRRALQSAADAASLAGTWQVLSELASDNRCDANVNTAVIKYATTNGAVAGSIQAVYVDSSGSSVGNVGAAGACPNGRFSASARGVDVVVTGSVPAILPGFVGVQNLVLRNSATAIARPNRSPPSAPVIPIAVSAAAYSADTTYDLFAHAPSGSQWPTLDLSSAGAPQYASAATEAQFWSDGQHLGNWQLNQPGTVKLLDAAYYDSVAAGLRDNVRRQALTDSSNRQYALVTVPVYDTASASPPEVHIVGFAQLKILASPISATSVVGTFVPYASDAYGAPAVPSPDVGNMLVTLAS
jgi:Flp pilus assembly protein TadG